MAIIPPRDAVLNIPGVFAYPALQMDIWVDPDSEGEK